MKKEIETITKTIRFIKRREKIIISEWTTYCFGVMLSLVNFNKYMVEEKAEVAEKPQIIEWEGIACQVKKIGKAELITTVGVHDLDYETAVKRIFDRASEASVQLQSLDLFDPEIPLPEFILRIAVLPRREFEKILFKGKLNQQDWAWAHTCCRTLKTFADTLVFDDSKIDRTWNTQATMKVDDLDEIFHENTHPLLHHGLLESDRKQTAEGKVFFQESTAQMVPRILLGFQKRRPDVTNFLLNLKTSDLVTVGTVNEKGYGCFPAKPVEENSTYGAIYLAGLAAVDILGKGNLENGIRKLIRTGQRCETTNDLWDKLEAEGVGREWLLETLEPMKRGQEVLTKFVSKDDVVS